MGFLKEERKAVIGILESLKQSDAGVTCEEYTILFVAGPSTKPEKIVKRMREHENHCSYHTSRQFYRSMVGTPVTEELEKAAMSVINKYA